MAEIRQFARGKNEKINLDDYLKIISEQVPGKIKELIGQEYIDPTTNKRVTITEADLPKLNEAYDILYKSFNERPEDLIYNYDKANRGFSDNRGQLNSQNNIHLGLITALFGNSLREMPLYEEKKSTPAIAPVDYNDKALGKIFYNRLLGAASPQDFIEYDPFENGTRLNINRAKRSADVITAMKNDLASKSGEFANWTDDQINLVSPQLDQLFTIFSQDGKVTDNEHFDISRILGNSNINKLYSVGQVPEEYIAQQKVTQDQDNKNRAAYIKKLRAIEQQFKPYSGQLIDPINLGSYNVTFGNWTANKLQSLVSTSSDSQLNNMLTRILSSSNYDLNNDPEIRRIFPENYQPFNEITPDIRNFFIDNILLELNRRNYLQQYNFGENLFYIPNTFTERNTGLVWDPNNNQIVEMSMHEIPYLQQYVNDWYEKNYQDTEDPEYVNPYLSGIYTMKQGGQIKKMEDGGFFDKLQQTLTGWSEDLKDNAWHSNTSFHGKAGNLDTVKQANDAYISNFDDVANDVRDYVKTFNNFNNLSAEDIVKQYNDSANKINSYWYTLDKTGNVQAVNHNYGDDASQHNALFRQMFGRRSGNGLGKKEYDLSYQDDLASTLGSQTWHRRMDRYDKKFADLTTEEKKKRIFTISRKNVNGNIENFDVYKENDGTIGLLSDKDKALLDLADAGLTKEGIKEDIINNSEKDPSYNPQGQVDISEKDKGIWKSETGEIDTSEKKENNSVFNKAINILNDVTPELFAIGKKAIANKYNKKVEDTLHRNSLLYNPINMSVPLDDALGRAQQKYNLGNDIQYQGYVNPISSDPDKVMADRYQRNLAKAKYYDEGDRLRDEAIEKSLDKRFALNKELTYYNDKNTYRANRDILNSDNQFNAQVKASRLKADSQSAQNLLDYGFKQAYQAREIARNAQFDNEMNTAYKQKLNETRVWQEKLMKYLETHDDPTTWSEYNKYKDAMLKADINYKNAIGKAKIDIYGNPLFGIFAKNGGKLIPKKR